MTTFRPEVRDAPSVEHVEAGVRGVGAPQTGFLPGGALVRRIVLSGAYAVLTVLLARQVATEIQAFDLALESLGGVLPGALQRIGPDPANVALLAVGLFALALSAGAHIVGRESGGGFALLSVGTVGWFLFPYGQVPWVTVFTGQNQVFVEASTTVWLLASLLVVVATAEVMLSARDAVVNQLRTRQLPDDEVGEATLHLRNSSAAVMTLALVVGGAIALVYELTREHIATGLLSDPDLIWVPALIGVAGAVSLWLVARRQ